MAWQGDFEKHRKLLLYVAHRVHRRMHAAGSRSVMVEDVFGELCVAWCVARDCWKDKIEVTNSNGVTEVKEVPFGAYLMRGMSNHINRWVDRELRQHTIAPFDLDAELSAEDSGTLHDVLADESLPRPEQALIEKDTRDFARDPMRWRNGIRKHKPLTPNAQKFLDLIENPPPSVLAIVKGLQARAAYGRVNLKIPSTFAPKRVTGALILDLMGIEDRPERASIYNQLELLADRVSQQ